MQSDRRLRFKVKKEDATKDKLLFQHVSDKDRFNVAALLTTLSARAGLMDQSLLRRMYEHLKLSKASQGKLLQLVAEQPDPAKFGKAVRSKKVRSTVLSYLLTATVADGKYDAREREGFRYVAMMFGIPWNQITALEDQLARELRTTPATYTQNESDEQKRERRWKIVAGATAAAVGAVLLTPIAAPAIGGAIGTFFLGLSGAAATSAGLATLGGGAVAAGGAGMAGGTATVAAALGLTGGGLVGKKVASRVGKVDEYRYAHLNGQGMHCFLAVSGFFSERSNPVETWSHLPTVTGHGEHHALIWESQHLFDLGKALCMFGFQSAGLMGVHVFARHACRIAARRFAWPTAILSLANIIDSPWSVARDRSEKAAKILAEHLATAQHGKRPITLIGFSLGARLIFHALEHLAKSGDPSKGLIDHVLLMGGAFSADAARWEQVRNIVAGRLVNAYCPKDWVLGYMYRTAELEFKDIAGLHPIHVQGVENVNVCHLLDGHTSYQAAKEDILRHVGLDDNC